MPLLAAFTGIVYVAAESIPGIPHDPGRLAMLLLHPVELSNVEEIGPNRFTTHLGQRYRYFPYPFWSDPARAPVLSPADLEQSILQKLPKLRVREAHITQEGDTLKLVLMPSARQELIEQLRQHSEILPTLLTEYDPESRARSVWSAGQKGRQGIAAPDGSAAKIGGAFLLISPQSKADGGGPIEDGFFQQMTPVSWARFRDALTRGQPFSLAATDGALRFELVLVKTDYHNPVDGQTITAPSGWRTYEPGKSAPSCGPIEPGQIVLLTEQDLIAARIPLPELIRVFGSIDVSVFAIGGLPGVLPLAKGGREMIVDFTLRGERPNLTNLHQIRVTPPLSAAATKELERRLSAIPTPAVSGGEVHFQLFYELRAQRPGEPQCEPRKMK